MKALSCVCGSTVFSDNTRCLQCGRTLGYEPLERRIICVGDTEGQGLLDQAGQRYQLCANRSNYQVCNGLVPQGADTTDDALCSACRFNRTIPVVRRPENLQRWKRLEQAKRHLFDGLARLGLNPGAGNGNPAGPMRFDFVEDQRSHPDVMEQFVSTGHKDGLITINHMEADDVQRVQQRELMGQRYRTLLGHFRHEAGHYFYPQLVTDLLAFTQVFGDPEADYDAALKKYYATGAPADWQQNFISPYASGHPLEDWAESFAHLLHITDALETAVTHGFVDACVLATDIEQQLLAWGELSLGLNEVSRSLGNRDAYPFVLGVGVRSKLAFINRAIISASTA